MRNHWLHYSVINYGKKSLGGIQSMENQKNHSITFSSNVTRNNSNENITINDAQLQSEVAEAIKASLDELKTNLKQQKESFKSLIQQTVMNQKEVIKAASQTLEESIDSASEQVQTTLEKAQENNE